MQQNCCNNYNKDYLNKPISICKLQLIVNWHYIHAHSLLLSSSHSHTLYYLSYTCESEIYHHPYPDYLSRAHIESLQFLPLFCSRCFWIFNSSSFITQFQLALRPLVHMMSRIHQNNLFAIISSQRCII